MQKRCFVGFDAFIDYKTKPIAGKENGKHRYFCSPGEYADFLKDRNDASFSIELEIPETRLGGNNPAISRILANCGIDVVSFGAYGKNGIDPVFLPLAKKCRLVSFTNPGLCTTYEFTISKIMNFYNMDKQDFTWENLINFISINEIILLLEQTDMFIFVNLGEQPAVLNIMEKFLELIFPHFTGQKLFFMDFSDCSHMDNDELTRSFKFINGLKPYGTLTISVNENEYRRLSSHAETFPLHEESYDTGVASLRKALGAEQLILRTLDSFYFSSSSYECQVPNIIVDNPHFLTGAGDAQNAGFCLGMLANMPVKGMLTTGVRAGNLFIRTGEVDPHLILKER